MFKFKNLIKIILLLFVVVSIIFLVYKELTVKTSGSQNNSVVQINNENQDTNINNGIVKAYYFHGNNRCYTCRMMEAYIQEALNKYFSKEIESGNLAWLVTNAQKPENQHFIRDFQITSISMILARTKNGKTITWKNLDEIWKLVRDKTAFINYIKTEIELFLKEK